MVGALKNRKNEVDSNAIFARDETRSNIPANFKLFCQRLESHAREGVEFAALISDQTPETLALQRSYGMLAKQAARLQSGVVTPEVEASLRLLLVRDLLAATEQEKNLHDNAMPVNNSERFKKLALFVGGGLLPFREQLRAIQRVNRSGPTAAGNFLKADAKHLSKHGIGISEESVAIRHKNSQR